MMLFLQVVGTALFFCIFSYIMIELLKLYKEVLIMMYRTSFNGLSVENRGVYKVYGITREEYMLLYKKFNNKINVAKVIIPFMMMLIAICG